MKPKTITLHRALMVLAAALSLGTLGASHARAQANLTFSGGLGAPLHLTLNAPVTYVVTASDNNLSAPYFDFQGVGNFGDLNLSSSTITFTINGGAAQTLSYLYSGFTTLGSVAADDALLFGSTPGVAVGDVVVLNAGTLTTYNDIYSPPASGSYQTFLVSNNGTRLDALNGVSVAPEPSTWALLGVGAAGLGLSLRRCRRARLG